MESYGKPLVLVAITVIMALSTVIFERHSSIMRIMTKNGINAWTRLSALFFAAIAVRLISEGLLLIW
jgi:small neutral amino acid transporter SnatA (MarC family)